MGELRSGGGGIYLVLSRREGRGHCVEEGLNGLRNMVEIGARWGMNKMDSERDE